MTQIPTVEEVVELVFDTEYVGGKQPNLSKDYLRTTLTNRDAAILETLVAELEGKKEIVGSEDKADPFFSEPRAYNTAISDAITTIKKVLGNNK